jgi:diacylglycerol kinase (ATP)
MIKSLFARGPKQITAAFNYSIKGLKYVWRNEAGFRQESIIAAILIPLAMWLGDNNIERALMISACLLVLLVEVINSAIEAAVDRHGDEIHPLSAAAKDMGSAAVLLSEIILLVIWGLLLV